MSEIIRIVIKGESGFGTIDTAYQDKLTITPDAIAYEYSPMMETERHAKRKWSYRTNSPIFQMRYTEIAAMVSEVLEQDDTCMTHDIGAIEFVITYADKTKRKRTFWATSDYFADLFCAIEELVPAIEDTPEVLL